MLAPTEIAFLADQKFKQIGDHIARAFGLGPWEGLDEQQREDMLREAENAVEDWFIARAAGASVSNDRLPRLLHEYEILGDRLLEAVGCANWLAPGLSVEERIEKFLAVARGQKS